MGDHHVGDVSANPVAELVAQVLDAVWFERFVYCYGREAVALLRKVRLSNRCNSTSRRCKSHRDALHPP